MSSSNTQRAGKSTRDRGNKSPSSGTAQSPKSANATDGHAKPPDGFNPKVQPTPEQIRLAQIINDPTKSDDPDIQKKVQQVMEVTGQSSDAVVIALHDCDNDPAGAIAMLIEGNKHEGEWETRGKKKKIRESAGQKGDGVTAPLSNKENRGMAPGRGGSAGPRARGSSGPQGGRGTSQRGSWRNKELEKNERNLEDGRPGDRGGDGRPPPRGIRRGGSRGGRGGGNVGGGPGRSSRTFQNRGYGGPSGPQEGFPQAMDTWTNNAGGHRDQRSSARGAGQHSDSMAVGNWNDLAASEDWSEEDWSGQLETKVFTASSSSGAPPAPPDTASIMQLLKEVPNSGGGEGPSSAPPSQQQQAPTLSVAQFNQQATETIKAAVGVGSVRSTYAAPSSAVPSEPVALVPAGPKPVAVPPRTKTPRVRVPPPSKIPESAVVMPDDAVVSSLDVQFGGLEFGTDTFDFGASDGMASAAAAAAAASHQPAPVQQDPTGGQVSSAASYLDAHSVGKGNAGTVPGPMGPVSGSVQGLGASQGVGGAGGSLHGKDSVGGAPSSLSMGPPVLSGSRPPGIPALGSTGAPKEVGQQSGQGAPGLGGPASAASSAAPTSVAGQKVGGVMGSEHLLLQSQGVSAERSKPVASSSAAGPQSKMYGQSAQRPSQGMDGGASVSKGVGEQPMYSSAGGGHHYSSSSYQQPGGSKGGLVGSSPYATLAHSQQGFANSASSSAQQHYYSPQQSTATSAFGQQQQSNGYQGSFQGNAYSSGSSQQQQQQGGYGVSSKLSGTSGLGSHSVKDSVLEAAQQQQQQHTYENSHGSATGGGLPSGPASTLATTASSLAGATATTSVLKNSMSATGKTLPNLPPGVPAAMLSHQYLVGNAAMPFYQQPLYGYEDLHLLQSRMQPLSYYDMQFQVPTTSLTGRDLTLNNMAYAEAKFGRGESSESSPGGAAGGPGASQGQQHAGGVGAAGAGAAPGGSQQQQQAAGQPFLNALPPPYGYYFTGMPGSIHHYGPPPMFPVPPATNAHGPTTNAQFQKANAYASHTFASGGYEGLTQTPDYAKGAYGAGSQGQAKGIPGSLGSADASRSGHARTHPHLAKSFEKPGFLAVTAPAPPQQQPPPPSSSNPSSSSSYPAFVPPRASPPSMAKQHHQLRQAYPFWGN